MSRSVTPSGRRGRFSKRGVAVVFEGLSSPRPSKWAGVDTARAMVSPIASWKPKTFENFHQSFTLFHQIKKKKFTWICSIPKDPVLISVPHKILNVAHLVVNGHEIFLVDGRAHFNAEQMQIVDKANGIEF